MKPTLLILAAGMASRYGSMKQIQSFGPSGETIMDYSVYDAIQSGFKKIVFIIRKDLLRNSRIFLNQSGVVRSKQSTFIRIWDPI